MIRSALPLSTIVAAMTAANSLACGPYTDWFDDADKEKRQSLKAYHSLLNLPTAWNYYRPYLQGKILLRQQRFADAAGHYENWGRKLRRQGSQKILNGPSLWAIRSANMRLLILQMTDGTSEQRRLAFRACDFLDAQKFDLAAAAARRVEGPLGAYMAAVAESDTTETTTLGLLAKCRSDSPLSPILRYRSVRYGIDHGTTVSRSREFLERHANHYLADDVLGWLARSYLDSGDRRMAASLYLDTLLKYPGSDIRHAIIESLALFRSDPFTFEPIEKQQLFTFVRRVYGNRDLEKLIHLKNEFRETAALRIVEPELLLNIVMAGEIQRYEQIRKTTSYAERSRVQLPEEARSALLRLTQEWPAKGQVSRLAFRHLQFEDLGRDVVLPMLEVSDDRVCNARWSARLESWSRQHTGFTDDQQFLIAGMPVGPALYGRISRFDFVAPHVTGDHRELRDVERNVLEAAYALLPELESIPMTEDEYRLYAMLYLRMCTRPDHLQQYSEARSRIATLSLNTFEQKELELLDAVYTMRQLRDTAAVLAIARDTSHPYQVTAGKSLAHHAYMQRDWPTMLLASGSCNMTDPLHAALSRLTLTQLVAALSGDPADHGMAWPAMCRRRAVHAVLARDIEWLEEHQFDINRLCAQETTWLPGVVTKILQAASDIDAAETDAERIAAEYAMATACYRRYEKRNDYNPAAGRDHTWHRHHRSLDMQYDCYLRLREFLGGLPEGHEQFKARALFTMATALQKAKDVARTRSTYEMARTGYGNDWFLQDGSAPWLQAAESSKQIADLYLRVANECPRSTLADDALYWSAFSLRQYSRHKYRFLHSPNRGQKEADKAIKQQVEALYTRILEDYPDGDFAKRVPSL